TMMAQNSISEDPETVSNSIKHYISQAQNDVNTGNYFSAQKNLEKALDDAVKIDDKRSIGLIHSNIGKLFYLLEDYDKALLSLTKAVEFQRTTNDYANNAETYKTFGNVYMSKRDYNQALEYYTSSKSLFEQVGNSDEYIAEILYYEGKIFNETGKYKQAKQSLEQCLVLGVTDQPNEIDTKATIQLSIAQLNLGNKEEALKLASEGL
ncbi:MAG: tetratricopeptide repeat protein, partial [Mangrovimonas sp.]|nr:tetratricopeptide repeat protein [Mangrovimonas sp.]